MFCLSKALSAPVGSLLAGSAGFVERARKARRMVGGGLRQAGVLASAGLVALRTMTRRLQEDHDNALALAQGLSRIEKLGIDLATVQTNMVNVDLSGLGMDSAQFLEKLGHHGIKANPRGPHRIRLVTHRHITAQAVERAVAAFAEVAA
jgi:threonine aldolase